MRALGIVTLCIMLIIGSGVVLYKLAYPTYTYRYRMTVEVLVDGVVHSGSSVIEVQIDKQPSLLTTQPVYPRVRGEAAFVDLGQGRNVFGLLISGAHPADRDYPIYLVPKHFNLSIVNDADLANLETLQGRWDLGSGQLPAFATFSNLADMNTVRVLAPNEFERVLGHGIQLKRVFIELTHDLISHDIDAKLPWLPDYTGTFGGRFGALNRSSFIRRS